MPLYLLVLAVTFASPAVAAVPPEFLEVIAVYEGDAAMVLGMLLVAGMTGWILRELGKDLKWW